MGTNEAVGCLTGMIETRYLTYTASDFARDPDFLNWRLLGDETSARYWEEFVSRYPEKGKDILAAIRIADSVRFNDIRFTGEEVAEDLQRIRASIRRISRRRALVRAGTVAATVLLFIGTLFFTQKRGADTDSSAQLARLIENTPKKSVRLILPGERVMEVEDNADIAYREQGITLSGEKHPERVESVIPSDTAGRTRLVVPVGRRSTLLLPDGSRMWVNAGTTVEFPARFTGNEREISVDGEIYIEVAPDRERPFRIHTAEFSVNVLGTHFNLSAYRNDPLKSVVLVEGSVNIGFPGDQSVLLRPNEMMTLQEYKVNIETVNTYAYTSWRDGVFHFEAQPLSRVLAALSKYYGVPIESDNTGNTYISGKLVLFDDLETVLDNITVIAPVQYRIKDDKILISNNL